MPTARIENWTSIMGNKLYGSVFGHPCFPDGDRVITSSIISRNEAAGTVTTRNTVYVLGTPAASVADDVSGVPV